MELADFFGLNNGKWAKPSQSKCGSYQIVFPFRIVGKSGEEKAKAEDADLQMKHCVFAHFAGPAMEVATGAPCVEKSRKTSQGGEEKTEKFIFTKTRGEGGEAGGA